MRALNRKLLRDIGLLKGQLIAIILVVACGIAAFVGMLSVHSSLNKLAQSYFYDYRFGDIFASVRRAPATVATRVAELDGVTAVAPRIAHSVTLSIPGLDEPGIGQLISLPDGHQPVLNALHLREGRWPTPGRRNEALISDAFADANHLAPGDELSAVIGSRYQDIRVVGIALSPEFVYALGPGTLWPDNRRFGVLWMDQQALASALDMEGAFNSLVVSLAPRTPEARVRERLDRLLAPYGGIDSVPAEKQTSRRFVSEELEQLASIGVFMPIVFLGVAAFLLNVVMTRVIAGQREQIAALKALGYGNGTIALHYSKLVIGACLIGCALGTALGATLGQAMMGVYGEFFRFPRMEFTLNTDVAIGGAVLGTAAGLAGAMRAVVGAVRLPPAEAMRPPSPPNYRRSVFELLGLHRLLPTWARIVWRNLTRHPLRTSLSIVGLSAAAAMVISGNFGNDAINYVMSVNFEQIERQDVTVTFENSVPRRAVTELEQIPGVLYAEPVHTVGVRLTAGSRSYETAISGVAPNGHLYRLIDTDQRQIAIPDQGLVLSRELGRRLGVKPGDFVTAREHLGRRAEHRVVVAALIDDMLGLSAYMNLDELSRTLRSEPQATGARLLLDPDQTALAYHRIKALPAVAGATLRTAAYEIFDETVVELQVVTALILAAFASVVAVGVTYNSARIIVSERSRELASLRVLGFTRGEVSKIMLTELWVQLALSLPLGAYFGHALAAAAMANIDTELYRMPVFISPRTYAFGLGVVLVSGIVTGLIVRTRLDRLSLVEVLKTRE